MLDFLKNEEKKVEYVELIYDLIFVYIIGRNNSLVSHITNGFIDPDAFINAIPTDRILGHFHQEKKD